MSGSSFPRLHHIVVAAVAFLVAVALAANYYLW
jgi:hypothetical protein